MLKLDLCTLILLVSYRIVFSNEGELIDFFNANEFSYTTYLMFLDAKHSRDLRDAASNTTLASFSNRFGT